MLQNPDVEVIWKGADIWLHWQVHTHGAVEIAKDVKEARRLSADPDRLEEDRDKDVGRIN